MNGTISCHLFRQYLLGDTKRAVQIITFSQVHHSRSTRFESTLRVLRVVYYYVEPHDLLASKQDNKH